MSLLDIQRRAREVGKIHLGEQRTSRNGKRYPARLSTFRFTSTSQHAIDDVARVFGGTVAPWQSPAGAGYEVVTDVAALDVIVPPEHSFSQWWELWDAGGCLRRCDGRVNVLDDGPCPCDPGDRDCQPTTRLSVIVTDLPGIGTWRVESRGYNAAAELPGTVALLRRAVADGELLPARLRIDERSERRHNPETGKPETRHYNVPVLDVDVLPRALFGNLLGLPESGPRALPGASGTSPPPAGDPDAPERSDGDLEPLPAPPVPALDEQLAAADDLKHTEPAVPIPETGAELRPSTWAPSPHAAGQPSGEEAGAKAASASPAPSPGTTKDRVHGKIMALARDAFPDVDQATRANRRHALTAVITGGERASTKDLSGPEKSRLIDMLQRVVDGAVSVVDHGDGLVEVLTERRRAAAYPLDNGGWQVSSGDRADYEPSEPF